MKLCRDLGVPSRVPGVSGTLGNPRVFADDARGWQYPFMLCLHPQGSLEKTLMLGKVEGGRRGQQMMRWLDGITDSME